VAGSIRPEKQRWRDILHLTNKIKRLVGWLGQASGDWSDAPSATPQFEQPVAAVRARLPISKNRRHRRMVLEQLEARQLLAADIRVGAVYIEMDNGTDLDPNIFYVTFEGGAPNTQLSRIVFDGDMYEPGLSRGDMIFHTQPGGLGADLWHPFEIVKLETKNPSATVKAKVENGSSLLVLEFTNFVAGDRLIFSIDVDEIVKLNPGESNLDKINAGIDPIASGLEFQGTLLRAEFTAPHYENTAGDERFLAAYDPMVDPLQLTLPRDNDFGRTRTAGVGLTLKQQPKPVSLSGVVWVDANENLRIDSGESRLANVQLDLYRLQGTEYVWTGISTVTDGQGRYSFSTSLGLQPGTYQVRQTQPEGYYSVGAAPGRLTSGGSIGQTVPNNPNSLTQIELVLGDTHAIELNFAENLPSSLSGNVCYVVSGMDCFSETSVKAPQANVLIELLDSAGKVVSTTRTGADGSYSFTNLRAGNYSLRQQNLPGRIDGSARAGSGGGVVTNANTISQIIIGGGSALSDYDFCDLLPAQISGTVYFDANNNGTRDQGETPLSGVLVQLWSESGSLVASARTNSQGMYSFTGLQPGIYRLTEQTPVGYLPGRASAGSLGGITDSTGDVIRSIQLGSGANGINYDFGELLPGSIQGRVIVDVNGNCIIDAQGEMPLSGVRMELLDRFGTLIASTLTDTQGVYTFGELAPGTYGVRQIQPAGFFSGGHRAGSGGGDASIDNLITSIVVNPGAELIDYNFCEIPPSSLSGQVFVDHNQNGIRDAGEPSIAGVVIRLINQAGLTVATATTDAAGRYSFDGLEAGVYAVHQVQPAGYLQGGQRAGSGGGVDTSADIISQIAVGAGASLIDYDFFELLPGSIAGIVFVDSNMNCIQEPSEPGLAGVRIDLLNASGIVIASTTTNEFGQYIFVGLRPGNYGVRQYQPAGYFQGGQIAPATGGDTSVEDLITQIIVGSGQAITDANFCELEPGRISGYVFQDGPSIRAAFGRVPDNILQLRDGQRSADDTPIAGVTIRLLLPDGRPAPASLALPGFYSGQYIETTTDSQGYYEFAGLPVGTYHLLQMHPENYVDFLDSPGSTGGFSLSTPEEVQQYLESLGEEGDYLGQYTIAQLMDVIFAVPLLPGQLSVENNFSEIIITPEIPVPPIVTPPPGLDRMEVGRETFPGVAPIPWQPILWAPLPLIIGGGHLPEMTWHLSVINGGFPRGARNGEEISVETVVDNTELLDYRTWTVQGMKSSNYRYISNPRSERMSKNQSIFYIPGAIPLMGDFNGDGYTELALFLDGEWFIDINANGKWDEQDIWLKLGSKGDQPIVGDWDGDGKDDIGVFGPRWPGDDRAIGTEPGMPDPENFVKSRRPKNVPRSKEETPDSPRIMLPSRQGQPRADAIDHVFRMGGSKDVAVAGDFNGDGVSTIGTFRNGKWHLDTTGDGRPDKQIQFGSAGDMPLVGDFDGDGIDDIAIVRGNTVIVDSNGNGQIDATDQVFLLESSDGFVIVGDFDGDGRAEPALYQSPEQRELQARRNAG
jgi:serine-aspartate repeat-containing protein C/D/E